SWNALAIRGLARAARALGRADFAASASRALRFIRERHWRDARLLATSRDGRAHLPAYLDDYAYLAGAVLELLTVRFSVDDLEFARHLIETILDHFADPGSGGLYFTSDEHETLIHRSMSFADDATPSGNGIAALVLQRMGYLLGETRYLQAAERLLRAAWNGIAAHPTSHVSLLLALDEYVHPPEIVILRGDAAEIERWRAELAKVFAPHRLTLAIPADAVDLPSGLAEKVPPSRPEQPAIAYICRGSVCSPPIDSLDRLAVELRPGTGVADPPV
ncbi:MAG: thioredoxin domain-containing protein, partial [Steroidobacteraceae bacterium]